MVVQHSSQALVRVDSICLVPQWLASREAVQVLAELVVHLVQLAAGVAEPQAILNIKSMPPLELMPFRWAEVELLALERLPVQLAHPGALLFRSTINRRSQWHNNPAQIDKSQSMPFSITSTSNLI
jgi:hypothetical protein